MRILTLPLLLWLTVLSTVRAEPGAILYDRVAAAAVEVLSDGRHAGSGWFAGPDGLVVTAAHMVWNKTNKIEVVSHASGRVTGSVVAIDRAHDLALVQVPPAKRPYPFLKVAARTPAPLTEIYLFGAALFHYELLLSGKVARATDSYAYRSELKCFSRIYYVAASSPHGTSGGCWVNAQGLVVGNQTGLISQDKNSVGIAEVVPPDAIRALLQTRRAPAVADMGAGIEELWEKPVEFIKKFPDGTSGVIIIRLYDNSPAKTADMGADMVITAVDTQPVMLRDEFFNCIRAHKPGDTVKVRAISLGQPAAREFSVTLTDLNGNK